MMRNHHKSPKSTPRRMGDRGSVAVEYALTLPILLAFIYGIMEISHFAYLKMTISDVAHDAVRYAIVNSASSGSPATTTTPAAAVPTTRPPKRTSRRSSTRSRKASTGKTRSSS